MKLGNVAIDVPVALAPMAGTTDLPFRLICRRLGCGYTVSEMISAKGLLYNNTKTKEMLKIDSGERPTAIQLFGSVPAELAEAARIVAESGADMIDLNMGCPVPKIVNNGEGSALMKQPDLAYEILAAMVKAVDIPVTVKFRAGWDDAHRNAVEVAKAAEAAGVAAVAVHGRTRQQFYEGKADWKIIAEVKKAVKIPVFGNGDIFSAADGLRMLIELKGEYISVKEMRRHISAYLKGMPHAAEYRSRFHKMDTYEQFMELLEEYRVCAEKYYAEEKHFCR